MKGSSYTVDDLIIVPIYLLLQSWVHGKFMQFFDPAAVELTASRGYESYKSKYLMRWTVVLSDILSKWEFLPIAVTTMK
jgi:hypothetical protein